MIGLPARNPCPKCNKDQRHTKGRYDCESCRGEGFVLAKMAYPQERTPYKRGPEQSKEDYKVYYDNFWAERGVKSPPATSIGTSSGRGIDVDEIGECYWADNGEPLNKPNWLWTQLLRFIDWLNSLVGADKTKHKAKTNGEQMATLGELFEPIIEKRNRPIEQYTQIGEPPPQQDMAQRMVEDALQERYESAKEMAEERKRLHDEHKQRMKDAAKEVCDAARQLSKTPHTIG